MRLEWIEDILAVLDTGSLAHAARKRLLTQSAFTRRVRLIEDSIGAELFDRRRKPVTLMAGVEALAPELRDLAARLRSMQQTLRTATSQSERTLGFACQHAITTTVSPWIVRSLTAQADVSVRVRSSNREQCLMHLLSGEVDFVVMYALPGEKSPFFEQAFEAMPLGRDVLVPVCAPALQTEANVTRLPAIRYPAEVFLGKVFERTIAPRIPDGVSLHAKAETALTLGAYEYALGGIGVAWLPRSMVAAAIENGLLIALEDRFPTQALDIVAFRLLDDSVESADAFWRDSLKTVTLPENLRR